ncbi:MAG: class I SAM-dependent methyltransferase [Promethearchaeota archaeon]
MKENTNLVQLNKKVNLKKAKGFLGEGFSRNADFLSSVVSSLQLSKDSKVLDVGTGRGVMAIILALHGYNVITGEPEGVYWADWKSSAKKVGVEKLIKFQPVNAEKLTFSNDYFDAVFLYTTFHHINNKQRAIKELFRIIKPNSILVIIELTDEGVELVRKRFRNHQDAVDPCDYTKDLKFEVEIIESKYLNAYIFKKQVE